MGVRLLVAEKQPISRAGVVRMLAGTEIEVTGQALDCDAAVLAALTDAPDVVLLDVALPGPDGFTALRRIRRERPALPVLMYSESDELNDLAQALQSGAQGYLSKSVARAEFLGAIRAAAAGAPVWTRPQLRRAVKKSKLAPSALSHDVPLTEREQQVLRRLPQGDVNEAIATQLGIDVETVKQHVKRILKKIGVGDRTQAALWAIRNGLD
jgi:DNA-binding NarL/FixJ family response regulator